MAPRWSSEPSWEVDTEDAKTARCGNHKPQSAKLGSYPGLRQAGCTRLHWTAKGGGRAWASAILK